MTPQPQQQYLLITEEELLDLLSFADAHDYQWTKQTEQTISSRPASSHNEHYTGVCAMQDKCNDYSDFLESIEDELSSDDEDPVCPIKCKLRMNPQSLRTGGEP